VTGATGFVGRQLCESLSQHGYRVRAALRSDRPMPSCIAEKFVVGEIGARTIWTQALDGIECVVHCAARAHVLNDSRESSLYQEPNAHGTEQLGRACAEADVRRIIFLSSVKVNGERTSGAPFTSRDSPNPRDAYAESKLYAENRLLELALKSALEVAIVRAPLIYGPDVRANFLRLMHLIHRRVPLPLGAVNNARSLVSVWNLCDLIIRLVQGPVPKSGVFMVSDGRDLSTAELIRRIGAAMKRRNMVIPVPMTVLQAISAMSGRQAEFERLCGSLEVDISLTGTQLGWTPPISIDEGLARTVRWYLSRYGNS